MLKLRRKFSSPLNRFVDCLWYSGGRSADHQKERLLPTGTADLIFKLREHRPVRVYENTDDRHCRELGTAVASGAYARHYAIDTTDSSPALGVHFRPGGAAPFLGVPLTELTNQHTDLSEIWGPEADRVSEQLMQTPSVTQLFNIVEDALRNRLADFSQNYLTVMEAVRQFTDIPTVGVRATTERTGFGTKRFLRLFREHVGLSPKLFCRVRRFQNVLDQLSEPVRRSWAHTALDNGYYDQSHLIRDFRQFSGLTPAEYRPVAGQKNHMIVPTAGDNFFQYNPGG